MRTWVSTWVSNLAQKGHEYQHEYLTWHKTDMGILLLHKQNILLCRHGEREDWILFGPRKTRSRDWHMEDRVLCFVSCLAQERHACLDTSHRTYAKTRMSRHEYLCRTHRGQDCVSCLTQERHACLDTSIYVKTRMSLCRTCRGQDCVSCLAQERHTFLDTFAQERHTCLDTSIYMKTRMSRHQYLHETRMWVFTRRTRVDKDKSIYT